MKIGVLLESFKTDIMEALVLAKQSKVSGLQIYMSYGQLDADKLSISQIADLKNEINKQGLEVSAICADMGGHGFEIAKDNPARIAKTKKIIDIAVLLNTHVLTTHIGVIPEDKDDPKFQVMLRAMDELGQYAKARNITLAIETGPEKATTLKQFLDCTHGGVGVNLDPANFVMVTDQDPVEAVHILGDYIVHTHAKDGIMIQKTDPKVIYNFFAEGGIEDLRMSDYFLETPLGEGKVPFDEYIQALKDVGYNGYLTIEREVGQNPTLDIQKAVKFLEKY